MSTRNSPRPFGWPFGQPDDPRAIDYLPCTGQSESHSCFELGSDPESSYYCPGCTQRLDWPRPRPLNKLHVANMRMNAMKSILASSDPQAADVLADPLWGQYHLACAFLTIDAAVRMGEDIATVIHRTQQVM